LIPFTLVAALSQMLFRWSFRKHSRKEIQKKWKLAGKFCSVEDAAALCMQAHYRKHSVMLNQFKQHVYAMVLQSAIRGAITRRDVKNNPNFASVAMAVHRDFQLQHATHHLRRIEKEKEEMQALKKLESSDAEESIANWKRSNAPRGKAPA
jgi:hypothetical protein